VPGRPKGPRPQSQRPPISMIASRSPGTMIAAELDRALGSNACWAREYIASTGVSRTQQSPGNELPIRALGPLP
jgi:hypothetical protein